MTTEEYLPDVDDSVPTYDDSAKLRARWGRKLRDGVHEAQVVESKIGYHQTLGEKRIELSFVVDGDGDSCPEGSVRVDLSIPFTGKFIYRNFRDTFFGEGVKLTPIMIESLVGARCKILTHFLAPTATYPKPKNFVDKIVAMVGALPPVAPAKPAEVDAFDQAIQENASTQTPATADSTPGTPS